MASKDKTARIYDAKNNYRLVKIIDDHSEAVIGVHFRMFNDELYVITVDKSGTIFMR
jgi:WD40 repeat protein